MQSSGKLVAGILGATLAFGGCAAVTSFDGFTGGGDDGGSSSSSGATSSSGTASGSDTTDAAGSSDAPGTSNDSGGVDAGPLPNACKDAGADAQIGSGCTSNSACCTAACSEVNVCAASCLAQGAASCSPQGTTCCTGLYCSVTAGTKCATCIPKGSTPEMVNGTANVNSCCQRKIQLGKCDD